MKLKCIGGLANGQIVDIGDLREHDQVRVPAKVTFELSSFEEDLAAFRKNQVPEYLVNNYHFYLIGAIHWIDKSKAKRSIYYLYPTGWDRFEALAYVIGA